MLAMPVLLAPLGMLPLGNQRPRLLGECWAGQKRKRQTERGELFHFGLKDTDIVDNRELRKESRTA
jgi:hypothetical protein